MKDIDYTYAVTNVRAKETELKSKSFFERLAADETSEEISDYENILSETWDYLSGIAPDKTALEFLIVRNDFHNFKAVSKGLMAGVDGRKYCIAPSIIDIDFLYESVQRKNFDSLPEWIGAAAESGYELLTSTADGRLFDMFIDKASLEAMIHLAPENEFCRKLANETVVFADIKLAKRLSGADENVLRYAFAECDGINTEELAAAVMRGTADSYIEACGYAELAEIKSLPELEKECADRIMSLMSEAALIDFGIEPLVAYYCARKAEQRNLRLIANAGHAGLAQSAIKERMLRTYV